MDLQHTNRVAFAIAEKHDLELDVAFDQMTNAVIWLIADESIKTSYSKQLSYLTTTNIANRVFLGGVKCVLPTETPNLLPIRSDSLNILVKHYGGLITEKDCREVDVKVLFGVECFDDNCIEAVGVGWRGGVNFYKQKRLVFEETRSIVSLGPIVAASIACYYAFCKTFKILDNEIELNTGISLWNLNSGENWFKRENEGPHELNMPRNIWALGLGHLGQAYLWTLGLMPFKNPEKSLLLLQDADVIDTMIFQSPQDHFSIQQFQVRTFLEAEFLVWKSDKQKLFASAGLGWNYLGLDEKYLLNETSGYYCITVAAKYKLSWFYIEPRIDIPLSYDEHEQKLFPGSIALIYRFKPVKKE